MRFIHTFIFYRWRADKSQTFYADVQKKDKDKSMFKIKISLGPEL